VRTRLLAVAADVSPLLGFDPELRFSGPIDAVVPDTVEHDLVAVLREALTNTARHAQATRVEVEVLATATALTMTVADDGVGIGESSRRSGLVNLRERAERHGGTFHFAPEPAGATSAGATSAGETKKGTHLIWSIPLS
jgi:signal transduction histidine kinase